jgi:hypothetical protein
MQVTCIVICNCLSSIVDRCVLYNVIINITITLKNTCARFHRRVKDQEINERSHNNEINFEINKFTPRNQKRRGDGDDTNA